MYVPIYISCSASLNAGVTITAYYDSVASTLKLRDVVANFKGKLELRAGVGCKYVSAGFYGGADMGLSLLIGRNVRVKKWDMNGEVGLYVSTKVPKIDYK